MIQKLHLERFKNFESADLFLKPFSVLFGANASGKSNLRDAFRILQGVGLGYSLADIFGGQYEGGVLQWRGIRGGTTEAAYNKASTFLLEVTFGIEALPGIENGQASAVLVYTLEIEPGLSGRPRVVRESLYQNNEMLFDSHPQDKPVTQEDSLHLMVRIQPGGKYRKNHIARFIANQPVISQIEDQLYDRTDTRALLVKQMVKASLAVFRSMRFLDLHPDAMRLPSIPGQTNLGDRGENLSSVLLAICDDPTRKVALTQWIQHLTPMDASDFEFPADQTGKVLVTLVEASGQKTSAFSASDGTLRFLAMIAALLGPQPGRLYFFEEIENGIHPTRLHLLIDLIDRIAARQNIQVIATTHSPQFLRELNQTSLEGITMVYRLSESPDAHLKRIMDLPADAIDVIRNRDMARLYESGWFEDIVSFMESEE